MSTEKEEKESSIPEEAIVPAKATKLSGKQKALATLVRQLTEASTHLVLKVATCSCNHKDTCDVYKKAKEIATIIDKLQETRGKVS